MSTLRDKINHAVEEARNCRPLSYTALDLLEDLFEKELRERMSACADKKTIDRIYGVSSYSNGDDFPPLFNVYATRDAAKKAVIREIRGIADTCGLPFNLTDAELSRALRNGHYSVTVRGARYSWHIQSMKVKG